MNIKQRINVLNMNARSQFRDNITMLKANGEEWGLRMLSELSDRTTHDRLKFYTRNAHTHILAVTPCVGITNTTSNSFILINNVELKSVTGAEVLQSERRCKSLHCERVVGVRAMGTWSREREMQQWQFIIWCLASNDHHSCMSHDYDVNVMTNHISQKGLTRFQMNISVPLVKVSLIKLILHYENNV